MGDKNISNNVILAAEHFGLISAANMSVRMSGPTLANAIGFSLKQEEMVFTFLRDGEVLKKVTISSESNIFVPISCSNLIGCKTCEPHYIMENNDDFVIEVKYENHDDRILKENCESDLCNLLAEVIDGLPSIEFSFRFKTKVNDCPKNQLGDLCNVDVCDKPDLDDFLNSLCNQNLQKDVSYVICCVSCLQPLSNSAVTFEKILSLPSDWSEIAENWFCHNHDNCDNEPSLYPKISELFVTPLHFNLNCSILKNTVTVSHVVKCEKCLSLLGGRKHAAGGMVQCFKDKIAFVEENSNLKDFDILDQSKNSVKFIVATIQKELRDSAACRFCLEYKVSKTEGTCLLLSVLNPNIQRFCIQKTLLGITDLNESFGLKRCIKVLYNTTSINSALARSWQHDFSVEVLRVSDSMLNAILKVLISSSKTVLRDHLVMNNLLVGFLPIID